MLAKKHRVSRPEFTRTFAVGTRRHTPLFTLVTTPSPTPQAVVVVSKKVAKKAHDRNRIRRRLYAAIAPLIADGSVNGTLLVLTKPAVAQLTKREFVTTVPKQIAESVKSQ